MKVLLINSVCGIKSTGRICTDLAEVLESQGHECKIAYGREAVPEKYQRFAHRIGSDIDVKIDAFKTRLLDNAGFNSVSGTKRFIKWIKEYNPDIIHLHNIHGYYINIKLLFKFLKEFGKPVVWTLHDCWAFTGHCSHFTVAGCEKWKTGCYNCPQKKAYPSSALLDRSKRNYKIKKELFTSLSNLTFITPSKWLASVAKQSYLESYEIIPIPNGVDLEIFKPTESDFREKYGLGDKKIILGAATAWGKNKGISDFVSLSKVLDENCKVVLVGMSETQAKEMCDSVLCVPKTTNMSELAGIYTDADVFLNLSRQETMGLTTVEAMACGTPVVTSNFTAVPEVVNSDGGIVVEDLKIENIKAAISVVLSKEYPDTRKVAENYEKSAQYEKYIQLYKKIITELKVYENP